MLTCDLGVVSLTCNYIRYGANQGQILPPHVKRSCKWFYIENTEHPPHTSVKIYGLKSNLHSWASPVILRVLDVARTYLGIDFKMKLTHSWHNGLANNSRRMQQETAFNLWLFSAHLSTLRLEMDSKSGILALKAVDPLAKGGEVVLKTGRKQHQIRQN